MWRLIFALRHAIHTHSLGTAILVLFTGFVVDDSRTPIVRICERKGRAVAVVAATDLAGDVAKVLDLTAAGVLKTSANTTGTITVAIADLALIGTAATEKPFIGHAMR